MRLLLAQASAVTSSSRHLLSITGRFARPGTSIYHIPFGVDTQQFVPPSRQYAMVGSTILFAKHLRYTYGPDILLRAIALLAPRYPRLRVLLAGDGDWPQLKIMAHNLGINDVVLFVGHIAHNAMPDFLSQGDIFVMPSRWESLGVSALEAAAMELPVVASRTGGIPEVVHDGVTGLLVPPEDPNALAKALEHLLDDPPLRHRMGKAGRQFVKANYEWKDNVAAMQALYDQVISGRAG
jgi:glycosyltransferase involved in cell wall biosynthesis